MSKTVERLKSEIADTERQIEALNSRKNILRMHLKDELIKRSEYVIGDKVTLVDGLAYRNVVITSYVMRFDQLHYIVVPDSNKIEKPKAITVGWYQIKSRKYSGKPKYRKTLGATHHYMNEGM